MLRYILGLALIIPAFSQEPPIREGLKIWLDASDTSTLKLDEKKRVTEWRSRVGKSTFRPPHHGPTLVENSLGNKPALHFEKTAALRSLGALAQMKEVSIFIVFRREGDDHRHWQKVLTNGTKTKGVYFGLGQDEGPVSTRVLRGSFNQDIGPDLWFATSDTNGWGSLTGDVAEVLVYDRRFYVEEPIAEIVSYLERKWGFQEDRDTDWTRGGPLPKKPAHNNAELPLSDQANSGKWHRHLEMWDEFSGPLDLEKWWDHNPNWYGRAPGRFLSREVNTKDGELQLSMRKDPTLPKEKLYGDKGALYEDYSSGTLKSKKATTYGYFEIEAQAMPSAGSSAWWFSGTSTEVKNNGTWKTEIDVFEIGARSPRHEHAFNMNAHIFQTPDSSRHWNKGGSWSAPFRFDNAFHIYGLEWTPEFIRYYVDGALVRSMKNTHWHAPMHMVFDSETMFDWLGVPEDKNLPSTFRVKYVRAWKNAQTKPAWWKTHRIREQKNSAVTHYVRKMEKNFPRQN